MNNCYMRNNNATREADRCCDDEFMYDVDRAGVFVDRVLALLGTLLLSLMKLCSVPSVRRVLRYAGVAVCFFCFLGLVGGIEQGLISAGLGVVVGLLLIFIEIFCLR